MRDDEITIGFFIGMLTMVAVFFVLNQIFPLHSITDTKAALICQENGYTPNVEKKTCIVEKEFKVYECGYLWNGDELEFGKCDVKPKPPGISLR